MKHYLHKVRLVFLLFLAVVLCVAFVWFYHLVWDEQEQSLTKQLKQTPQTLPATAGAKDGYQNIPFQQRGEAQLQAMIAGMSAEGKAGQLLMFAAQGKTMTADYEQKLKQMRPGGVIMMGGNISDETQLARFTEAIKATNNQVPMIVAVDQEGGVVKRLKWDETGGQKMWSGMSLDQLCAEAKVRARVLKSAGINTNFSPVVDLTNPEGGFINNRTISASPDEVIMKAGKYVDCLQSEGVAATLKHYPGHGLTTADSHFVLPTIVKTKQQWIISDGKPYQELQQAKLVMVGHLLYENIDPKQPASQSEALVSGLLRAELGYQGVVVSDDMGQLHTSTKISSTDAMRNAVNAGVDVILYVNAPLAQEAVVAELAALIDSGEVSEARVNAALLRILKLKQQIV